MIFKIPLIGWISTKIMTCTKCKKSIGHYVDGLSTEGNSVFHPDCHIDFIAESEGWTEYRENYKMIQEKYGIK